MMRGRWLPLLLVLTPGVFSGWGVLFGPQCALWGSSIVIKCSYDYAWGHIVKSVTWSKRMLVNGKWQKVALPDESAKYEYTGNYRGNCDLKIKNIQFTDEGSYYFSFTTTLSRWSSQNDAQLSVRDLTAVLEPSTVTEGERVSLTCRSGCPSSSGQVWFKDGKPFSGSNFRASRESSGRYHCALSSVEGATSVSVELNVLYAPLNVVLRKISTEDTVKGSSVTLSCSSDANPPVSPDGYSMYKDNHWISFGPSLTIPVLEPRHSGRYHCQAWNNVSRAGEATMASADVDLDVKFSPVNVTVSVDPVTVEEGSGVNLTCRSEANPPATRYTWYKQTSSPESVPLVQVGSGPMLALPSEEASLLGHYLCRAGNHLGERNSTLVRLSMSLRASDQQTIFILAGIGVGLLILTVLLFWYKQRSNTKHNSRHNTDVNSSSFTVDESHSNDYVNIYANVTSAGQKQSDQPRAQEPGPHRKTRHDSSYEADITYTTVNFKPRSSRYAQGRNVQRTPQQPLAKTPDDHSVIYSTVGKPAH
ncbi:B-cell receptor CD22-like [Synchiropus splendidus]|uniref:B-cell receptor CD22-like n=1 Tax=Synchiropus splendidus TaxID=270530 RepID=UPI00237DE035|nr:B-cell receptor CD22-like [Synchiropus splendidus]